MLKTTLSEAAVQIQLSAACNSNGLCIRNLPPAIFNSRAVAKYTGLQGASRSSGALLG